MPLSDENISDYISNDMPKCPHCDRDIHIEEHELWELYEEDKDHNVECPYCGKEFRVYSMALRSFCTDEQEDY